MSELTPVYWDDDCLLADKISLCYKISNTVGRKTVESLNPYDPIGQLMKNTVNEKHTKWLYGKLTDFLTCFTVCVIIKIGMAWH